MLTRDELLNLSCSFRGSPFVEVEAKSLSTKDLSFSYLGSPFVGTAPVTVASLCNSDILLSVQKVQSCSSISSNTSSSVLSLALLNTELSGVLCNSQIVLGLNNTVDSKLLSVSTSDVTVNLITASSLSGVCNTVSTTYVQVNTEASQVTIDSGISQVELFLPVDSSSSTKVIGSSNTTFNFLFTQELTVKQAGSSSFALTITQEASEGVQQTANLSAVQILDLYQSSYTSCTAVSICDLTIGLIQVINQSSVNLSISNSSFLVSSNNVEGSVSSLSSGIYLGINQGSSGVSNLVLFSYSTLVLSNTGHSYVISESASYSNLGLSQYAITETGYWDAKREKINLVSKLGNIYRTDSKINTDFRKQSKLNKSLSYKVLMQKELSSHSPVTIIITKVSTLK